MNMNGVEILSSAEIVSESVFNWTAFWIVTAVCFVVCLIVYLCIIWEIDIIPWTIAITAMWIFASVMLGGLFGGVIACIPTNYATEYKVYLQNDVNIEEFIEKYEIINQEEKILIIRERDR